jgi:GNAT superfamily N-acetyltransferase
MTAPKSKLGVQVRPLIESDLPEADRIVRLAFGTFQGLPDPLHSMSDTDPVRTRWRADPSAVLAAEHEGKLIGSNFAANWGSFGCFGPLTVHPDYWDRGVAQQLLEPTMDIFRRWGSRHIGLYTYPQSPKHMSLYQKFGFWPRDLIAIMSKGIESRSDAPQPDATYFSGASLEEQRQILAACSEVTNENFEGLDVEREIHAVSNQKLGDTVLIWEGVRLAAFAVCHVGAGTEAGSGICYIKFAGVRPNRNASQSFCRLVDSCEALARNCSVRKLTTGVNLARREAYSRLCRWGFRPESQGVAMETGDQSSGYNHAGIYILDDWR